MQEKTQQTQMDIQQLPDEEVFRMSSEALRIADKNTAKRKCQIIRLTPK